MSRESSGMWLRRATKARQSRTQAAAVRRARAPRAPARARPPPRTSTRRCRPRSRTRRGNVRSGSARRQRVAGEPLPAGRLSSAEVRRLPERPAALRDGPVDAVVAALHAAQRAALEVDDLAGDDADLRDRRVARRRAGDRDGAADRVERVADVADGEDQRAAVAAADDVGGADAQVRALARRVQAQAADEVLLRDDAVRAPSASSAWRRPGCRRTASR